MSNKKIDEAVKTKLDKQLSALTKDRRLGADDLYNQMIKAVMSAGMSRKEAEKYVSGYSVNEGKPDKRATKEKGGEWAKHLRKDGKKTANKKIRKQSNESETLTEPTWLDDEGPEEEMDEAQFPDVYGAMDSAANRAKAKARDAKKKIRKGIDKLRGDKKKDQERAKTEKQKAMDRINSKDYDKKIKKQLDRLNNESTSYSDRVKVLTEHLEKKSK